MTKFKFIISTLLVGVIGFSSSGCAKGNEEVSNSSSHIGENVKITVSGSTSVGPLMEKIQEEYEKEFQDKLLEIQQPGSGTGIKNVIEGVAEIGMSSRELKSSESEKVKGIIIAHDGIVLLVNPENKVKDITLEEVNGVFTGKITNWSQLGGDDWPIVIVSREEGSGTRDAFQEIVGFQSEELISSAMISDGSGAVKTTVAGNKNAIGYASFEYIDNTVYGLKLQGVEPTGENVKAGKYKLSRPFMLVTNENTLTENGKALIDYCLSEKGQKIVSENKLISID